MRLRAEVKITARVLQEKSHKNIHEQVMTSTLPKIDKKQFNEVIPAIPDFACMRSSSQRVRMEGRPPVPASLDVMKIDGE